MLDGMNRKGDGKEKARKGQNERGRNRVTGEGTMRERKGQ